MHQSTCMLSAMCATAGQPLLAVHAWQFDKASCLGILRVLQAHKGPQIPTPPNDHPCPCLRGHPQLIHSFWFAPVYGLDVVCI